MRKEKNWGGGGEAGERGREKPQSSATAFILSQNCTEISNKVSFKELLAAASSKYL